MGFDTNGVKLLIHAQQLGIDFSKTATIGRQGLILTEPEMRQLLQKAGLIDKHNHSTFTDKHYAESFLHLLGAKTIDALDASGYEGATLIHDLNYPIPDTWAEQHSLMIDGGSLEHVFNFPVAIKNCMKLIKEGGHYIAITPTNNFVGHGFYQFSPELYFRIFNKDNGFEIVKMYFYIDKKNASIYEIADPMEVKRRVTLSNSFPSYLFVIARKTAQREIFAKMPQQSDYEHIIWKNKQGKEIQPRFPTIRQLTPTFIKKVLRNIVNSYQLIFPRGISDSSLIRKIDQSKIETPPKK